MRSRIALACAGAVLTAFVALPPHPAAAAPGCDVLQIRVAGPHGPTTVYRVSLPGSATTRLGTLPFPVDAAGYSPGQELVYGVAPGPRVIVIDGYGRVRDLGVIRRGSGPNIPARAQAGAIGGTKWYLRAGARLYTVDIDPGSRKYLRVVSVRPLHPGRFTNFADFAADPKDGRLRGVAVSGRGDVIAISVDPASGSIRPDPAVQLPASLSFGSVVLGADGSFYAATREAGGRGKWYRVPPSGAVEAIGNVPGSARTDAAGCLPALRRVPQPPDAGPLPPIPPPRLASPPDEPSPREPHPAQPPESDALYQQEKQLAEEEEQDRTAQKRGWGLAAILLILGAGAAARRH